ncbi:MAG: M48 family metalloprotease [Arenicellales bacterium]|jgi:hypothetical protein|nr:M48 family metalloprotease [Arenicellales bacterium]
MKVFDKPCVWITLIAKSTFTVLVSGITVSSFAGPADDEQLLGLWQSDHGCVVHIFEDESGSLAGAAWGKGKESAELIIEFSGDRRFAWKRKTKKSGFGDDGEVDPKRSGRFIVDLHDRQVLHSDNWPCYHQRTGPAAKFSRLSPAKASGLSVPDWYSDTLSQVIEGGSGVGTAKAKSQPQETQVAETSQPTSVAQSLQGVAQNNQAEQTSQSGGLGGLFNALNTFNQQMQEQVAGQFPNAASNQGQSSALPSNSTESGGLAGLFGAAGKKKNRTTSPSSGQGQSSTTGLGGLLSGLATADQPSSGSDSGPRNLEEFRELVTMGPVDAHFLGKTLAEGEMLGSAPAFPVTDSRVRYVQAILDTLVRYSRTPFVYREYVAMVLDDDEEINAFAAPGGFMAVYTGMLNLCENEDELALVLAHELAHSELDHGISAIVQQQSSKFFGTFAGGMTGNDLVGNFANSLYDIGVKGYNVEIEAEADERALLIAERAGYDPKWYMGVMEKLHTFKGHYGGEGYPPNRAELIRHHLGKVSYLGSTEAFAARSARFHTVFGH